MFTRQLPSIDKHYLSTLDEQTESKIRDIAFQKQISIKEAAFLFFSNDNKGNKTLELYTYENKNIVPNKYNLEVIK